MHRSRCVAYSLLGLHPRTMAGRQSCLGMFKENDVMLEGVLRLLCDPSAAVRAVCAGCLRNLAEGEEMCERLQKGGIQYGIEASLKKVCLLQRVLRVHQRVCLKRKRETVLCIWSRCCQMLNRTRRKRALAVFLQDWIYFYLLSACGGWLSDVPLVVCAGLFFIICISVRVRVCVYGFMYVRTHSFTLCMCVFVCVCVFLCVHVCSCSFRYIYICLFVSYYMYECV